MFGKAKSILAAANQPIGSGQGKAILASGGSGGTVGLDIETASIAATELHGRNKVDRTAIQPLAPGIVAEGEVQDPEALSNALKELFSEHKLSRNVRLGVANQRVVVRTLRLPMIEDEDELATAIRFQAQDQIPMPLDEAVLDHQVVARETGPEGERQMDVLAVAARRDMVTSLLGALRNAGLNPVGIDLAAFGVIRAFEDGNGNGAVPDVPDSEQVLSTKLYCYLGDVTNLAVARGSSCVFTRVAPFGLETIAETLAGRQEMPLDDAREWLYEVGLEEPIDAFDEDQAVAAAAREALQEGASKLVDELRLSLEFYGAQEGAPAIEQVLVCGPGATVHGLPEHLQTGLGLPIESQTPHALAHLDEEDAARLTVSYGLALEE
jgi:type IV pilus assembly protein PilM